MNLFKKLYCRIYQLGFKIILPFLPYRKPIIFSDNNQVKDMLLEKNFHTVMIVTDQGIVKAGLLTSMIDILQRSGIDVIVYDRTVPNPTVSCVEEARKLYLEKSCQAIIAFGGGSPMDLAKILGARIVKPKKSVQNMKGLLKICKKLPVISAVPTTSGTGSEVTVTAVITDDKTHFKYPINDFCLIPKYALLDYHNTLKLPPHITSTTGMDALTHAVESFISKTRTPETKKMALNATKLIYENLYECYKNPSNEKARENMLFASHYAGIAFTKAYVGYVHAIAHSLGGKYNIPHGLANAIILPIMLEVYGKSVYKPISILAKYAGIADINDTKKVANQKFIRWVYSMNAKMNIPLGIEQINEEDIEELARVAEKEANPLYPVPRLLDKQQIKAVYLLLKNKSRKKE